MFLMLVGSPVHTAAVDETNEALMIPYCCRQDLLLLQLISWLFGFEPNMIKMSTASLFDSWNRKVINELLEGRKQDFGV